jgi:hypothetical protein
VNNEKVDEVLSSIIAKFGDCGPCRADTTLTGAPFRSDALRHALWMAIEARLWPAERIEKKFRWLGFIQGILWMTGELSIAEAKEANRP